MKRYKLLTMAVFLAILITSCDVIEKPYAQNDGPIITDTGVVRKILLEDFTAFRCPNCPRAAEKIKEIHSIYGDRVIPIAIHCGSLSVPKNNSIYTYDFRTADGTLIEKHFNASASGLPNGMINRKGYSKDHIQDIDEWTGIIDEYLSIKADLKISITPSFTSSTIGANIAIEYLNNTEGGHQLAVVLLQDSIIDAQTNLSNNITNYTHNHIYRAPFNTAWGEQLNQDDKAISKGTKFNKSYSLPIKADSVHPWLPNHLKIVAYVYDTKTYEVLQAEEVHVQK